MKNGQFPAVIQLSNLNGQNGFKMDGESMSDISGRIVASAGDVNKDGIADFVIGAYGHNNAAGRSYVIFGNQYIGKSSFFSLSGLNGTNGFKMDGEVANDFSGLSAGGAGDMNGDGYADLFVGAPCHNSNTGRSYVVFGGPGVGNGGLFNLSSLMGSNGFKLDGENTGDDSGLAVSLAGDINGDGCTDLLIGAQGHASLAGRSYLIFGSPSVGVGGTIALSSFNGVNGFKLDSEASGDQSGVSVGPAGDINGDGIADILVGAYGHANSTGRSYVVFGDIPPVLVQNCLNAQQGKPIQLNSTYLSAYDRNHPNNTIVFVLTNVSHGHFELASKPGVAINNFTQPQLINGSVSFVHDGSAYAPSYNITIHSVGIAWTGPSAANITFIPAATTTTSVFSTTISPSFSSSTTPTMSTTSTVTPTTTGMPSTTVTPMPTVTLSPSTTPSPTSTPSTTATSTPGLTSSTTPQSSTVAPTPTSTPSVTASLPVLVNNQLTLSDGETVVLSSANLQAVEAGMNASSLIFYVSNVQIVNDISGSRVGFRKP